MRKVVAVLGVLGFLAFVPSMLSADVNFDLGVKGGLSSSKVKFEEGGPGLPIKSLGKPVFGVFFSLNLNPTFSIQPEAYLVIKGGSLEKSGGESVFKLQPQLTYIHVPVLAKAHIVREGKVKPIVFAGPAVSFLTKAVQRYYEDGTLLYEEDIKEKGYVRNSDFGIVFGGGLEFALGKALLVLDVRYDLGLVDVDAESDTTVAKNRALMLLVGIGF